MDTDGGGQLLGSCCRQPPEGTEGVGLYLADAGDGGIRYEDIGAFLHINNPGDPSIWFIYVGHDHLHVADPGGVPPLYDNIYRGKTPLALILWDMELTSVGRGRVGSEAQRNGGLHWEVI